MSSRDAEESWPEPAFFEEAEARSPDDVDGLRILLEAARLFRRGLYIFWGSGSKEPRFILRRAGTTSGDLVSGWASGGVGVRITDLREFLADDADVLDRLEKAIPDTAWASQREPLFSAAELKRPVVTAAMVGVLAAIAESAD